MAYFRKRGDKWSFTVDIGVDSMGKRKQKTVSGFSSKKEAEKACAELITNIDRGEWSDNKDTVEGFMRFFFENQVKMTVSERTYETQKATAEKHIYPVIGKIKLAKLTALNIQRLYSIKLKEGLAGSYVSLIGIILGKALKAAHTWGLITKNVAQSVKKPSSEPKKFGVWTQAEVSIFLESSKDSDVYVAYVLMLMAGIRVGEVCALKWVEVDFDNSCIYVMETMTHTKGKRYLKDPKTLTSRRLVTIPAFVNSYLKKYKLLSVPNERNLVLPGLNGKIMYRNFIGDRFEEDVKKAGLPRIRLHDLRHTHATLLLLMGENPKVVQERLGHKNITTTLNTYSHVLPSMQKQTADKLDDVFSL